MNWIIKASNLFFPYVKRIFVDQTDTDLFKKIHSSPHKKIVAVVNQWHMEGIEHHWCHTYAQTPRSVEFNEPINPIGDMDLRRGLFDQLWNAMQREVKSAHHKSVPLTFSNMLIGYHRETIFHYEHRDM